MEVKKGYKQTEVGVIPDDWNVIPMGKIFEFKNGLNKAKGYFGKGTPIVNYMDVFNNPGLFKQDVDGKVTLTVDEIRNYQVKKGDVFFTRTSETVDEIGMSSVLLENIIDAVFSGFVLRGRPKNDILDLLYKQYCFRSKEVRKQICSTSSYTTRALTNGKLLSNVYIAVPSTKAEQTTIASALSDADALIQSLEKLIAKKRLIKQGAMQELLKPKEGWVVKKLGEIISFVVDNRGKTPPLVKTGHPLIEVNAIYKQGKSPNYSVAGKFVDQMTYDSWFRDGHPQIGDVLVVTVGTAGSTCFVTEGIGCIAQNIIALRLHKTFSSEYFYYLTLTNLFQDQVRAVLMGAVQPSLKVPHLREFSLPFPSPPEQTRIATILADMDAEISALETKLAKYKQVKQGMMQNLLTGKIRLV